MNGHEHIEQGEHELAVADTKVTYGDAARAHVQRATAHFTAAVAYFLADADPDELREAGCESPGCGPHRPCSPECEAGYDVPLPFVDPARGGRP
jgi:hypothetical protein